MKSPVVAVLLVAAIVASSVAGYDLASYTATGNAHSPVTLSQVTQTVTATITHYVTNITIMSNTSSSTSCSATGEIGCPHFFDMNWTIGQLFGALRSQLSGLARRQDIRSTSGLGEFFLALVQITRQSSLKDGAITG